ncbi:hypothetical protein [Halorubrum trueperi]|uniref:Uncharacterized protein n=1 Tax=Halorubrum trueperi TaxID=2004704 RepID=A0ABD5UH53_9EURY
MTGSRDEPGDEREQEDLDELRPPSTTTDPVQDPVALPDAVVESGGVREGERRGLDEPRPPSTTTDPVQDPVEPAWRERDGAASSGDEGESGAGGDGV